MRKERRLALAEAGKGVARRVRTKAPLLTWPDPEPDPDPDPYKVLGWLHDSRERAITRTEKAQKFLESRQWSLSRIDFRNGFTLVFPS